MAGCGADRKPLETAERRLGSLPSEEMNTLEVSDGKGFAGNGGTAETSILDLTTTTEVTTESREHGVYQYATVHDIDYSFTVDLEKWDGHTSQQQIEVLEDLFWEVYPQMYERFGIYSDAPRDVVLKIENDGYEVAEASCNSVHLHDMWLAEHPSDYDCFTHELAHVIQNGWNGDYLEYDAYIERFADYCRYIYAYEDGMYNDAVWDLQTIETEDSRETSARFLVWLDYTLSSSDNDFMVDYFRMCSDKKCAAFDWDAAWNELFTGTRFEQLTIEEVWGLYESSDFAYLSSHTDGKAKSELIARYELRGSI